jgi:hypothetical protein
VAIVVTQEINTPEVERACQNAGCSNTFEPRHPRQKSCSNACRLQHWQDRNPFRGLDNRLRAIEEGQRRLEARLTALERKQPEAINREALVRR